MVPSPIHVAFYVAAGSGVAATWEDRAVSNSIIIAWDELCAELSRHEFTSCGFECAGHDCTLKMSSEAWSPVELTGRRSNANVRAVTLAVFDLDDVPNDVMIDIAKRIDGLEYLCVSSHSHRPPAANRLRLIMPMTRPALPSEWPTVLRTAISVLELPADPVCKDLARLYFLPTAPSGTQPLAERGHGVLLDVDLLLQIAAETGLTSPQLPAIEHDREFDNLPWAAPGNLAEMRKRLVQVRARKAKSNSQFDKELHFILDQILHNKPFAVPGNFQGATDMLRGRDNAINKAASLVAFALPASTPTGAAVEILRPSLSAMECAPEGLPFWLSRAVFSYERAMVRRLERDAKADVANTNLRARLSSMARPQPSGFAATNGHASGHASGHANGASALVLPPQGVVLASPTLVAPDGSPITAVDNWQDTILYKAGKPLSCGENVFTVLANADETRGFFMWDEMEKTFKITGGIFEHTPVEMLDVEVTDWLQREWNLTVDLTVVGKRIERAARLRTIDPLAEYLRSLPAKWDGVPRIRNYLLDYCHATRINAAGKDITEHIRRVSECFFISLVARPLDPGCQVDTVLILEGPEGYFKTSMFRVLSSPWFCGNQITLGDKDSLMLAAKNWLLEMPELASWRKADTYTMNAFITNKIDQFRFPYGSVISKAPRRCILVGSVNPEASSGYFQNTGGVRRRYWPISIGAPIDIARVEADREQLLAEAVVLYIAGSKWWFSAVAQAEANEQVEERLIESTITQTLIAEWWFKKAPAQRPMEVSTLQIAKEVMQCSQDTLNNISQRRAMETDIGMALNSFRDTNGRPSFTKSRKTKSGVQQWLYFPSEEFRNALHSTLRTVGTPTNATDAFGKKKP